MEPAVSRRNFIQTLTAASLSALSAPARDLRLEGDSLQRVPFSLPHLDSIRVYPATNYKHILVHIRQSHESNHYDILLGVQGTVSKQTLDCQTAIRKGIGRFLDYIPCNAIYVEGLLLKDVELMRGSVNGFRDVTREQERFRRKTDQAKSVYESQSAPSTSAREMIRSMEASVARFDLVIGKTVSELDRNSISHSTAIQIAAAHNLTPESPNTQSVERFLERFSQPYEKLEELNNRVSGMKRRASEISQQYLRGETQTETMRQELLKLQVELEAAVERKAALAAEISRQFQTEQANIYSAREEAIVGLIASRPRSLTHTDSSLVLLGAKHDLVPEVTAYNAKNRDNAIALVVITPKGLDDIPER